MERDIKEQSQRELFGTTFEGIETVIKQDYNVRVKLDRKNPIQFSSSNKFPLLQELNLARNILLARDFRERDLPLEVIPDMAQEESFAVPTQFGHDFHLQMNIIGDLMHGPLAAENREAYSIAAVRLFKDIAPVILDLQSQDVVLSSDPSSTIDQLDSLLKRIVANASGSEKEDAILKYLDELEDRIAQTLDLSLTVRGAQLVLRLGGRALHSEMRTLQRAILDHLAYLSLPKFINWMKKNTTWFLNPDEWAQIAREKYLDSDAKSRVIRSLGNSDLLDDQKLLFESIRSSSIGINIAVSRGIAPEEQKKLESSGSPEPGKKERNKKANKKKSAPSPRQVFSKKVRQPRVTQMEAVKPSNGIKPLEIKSEPPAEYVIETDVARRLREKAEERAEEKAERKRRRAEQHAAYLQRQARREQEALIIQRRNASRAGVNSSETVQAPPVDQQVVAAAPHSPKMNKETQDLLEKYSHLLEDSDVSGVLEDPGLEHLDDASAENFERITPRKVKRQED